MKKTKRSIEKLVTTVTRQGWLVVLITCLNYLPAAGQSWVQLNDIGTNSVGSPIDSPPVSDALTLSASGKIFVIGSRNYTSSTSATTTMLWEYIPATDTWWRKHDYPGNGNRYLCGFAIGDNLYIGCGSGSLHINADFYKYNAANDQWTHLADIPAGRTMGSGFSISGKGYVTGGEGNTMSQYLDDLWQYDTTANTWTQKANFPGTARALPSTFSTMGSGFVGLGFGSNQWFTDLHKYDPVNNTWSTTTSLPAQGRGASGIAVIGNKAVLLFGNNGMTIINDGFVYDAGNGSWASFAVFNATPRSIILCGSVGNRIFAGGGSGAGGGQLFKDWWTIQTPVGLNENKNTAQTEIITNQAGETILKTNNTTTGINYSVYDLLGRLVCTGGIKGTETSLTLPAHTVYVLVFDTDTMAPIKFCTSL